MHSCPSMASLDSCHIPNRSFQNNVLVYFSIMSSSHIVNKLLDELSNQHQVQVLMKIIPVLLSSLLSYLLIQRYVHACAG